MWSQNQAFLECSGWLVETLVSLKAFRFCSYMDDPKSTSSTETLDFWHPTKVDVLAFYSSYYKQVQVFPPDHQRLKVDSFEKWHLIPTNGWLESLTSKRSLFFKAFIWLLILSCLSHAFHCDHSILCERVKDNVFLWAILRWTSGKTGN